MSTAVISIRNLCYYFMLVLSAIDNMIDTNHAYKLAVKHK